MGSLFAVIVGAVLATAGLAPSASAASFGPAPFAVGDSAANIPLQGSGVRVMIRWVPKRSGVVQRLHLRVKLDGARCSRGGDGYASGDGGSLEAWTYRVGAGGRPLGAALRHARVTPCALERDETLALPLGLAVTRGREYATVVRNAGGDPRSNYFSLNFLYSHGGLVGANARNERRAAVADSYYGMDPREIVGYSTNGGRSWELPGGPYGGQGGRAFLPSYLLEWRGGGYSGQPFYYSYGADGEVAMTYRAGARAWTIRAIGAYTGDSGSAEVRLLVNGRQRASVRLSGDGHLRAAIPAIRVPARSTVTVVTRAGGGGLALRQVFADALWSNRLGLGRNFRYFSGNGDRDPISVYPLPAPG